MTLKSVIKDGRGGTGNLAEVSSAGELVVKGFGDVQSKFLTLNSTAVGFNFFPPLSGQNFVVTTIIFDTGVATTLTVYEASNTTTTTVDKTILTASLTANQFITIALPFGGFLPMTEGEFLNVKVSAQPVNVTISGFYRPIN